MKTTQIYIMIPFLFLILMSGCCGNKEANKETIKTSRDGLFSVIIEINKSVQNKILITKKINYHGDKDTTIKHSKPLISIASPKNDEVMHFFDDALVVRTLKKNEVYIDGVATEYEIKQGKNSIHILAQFQSDNKRYEIPIIVDYIVD